MTRSDWTASLVSASMTSSGPRLPDLPCSNSSSSAASFLFLFHPCRFSSRKLSPHCIASLSLHFPSNRTRRPSARLARCAPFHFSSRRRSQLQVSLRTGSPFKVGVPILSSVRLGLAAPYDAETPSESAFNPDVANMLSPLKESTTESSPFLFPYSLPLRLLASTPLLLICG